MVLSVIIPLISAFTGAIASTISKKIIDEVGAVELTTLTFASVFLMMAPLSPHFFKLSQTSLAAGLITLIILLDAAANVFFFKAMEIDDVTKTSALNSLAPLFTALLVPFFLPSQFGIKILVAATGITLSVYFIQTGNTVKQLCKQLTQKKNYLVLTSAVIFGFTAIPTRLVLNEYNITNPSTLYWIRSLGIFLIIMATLKPNILQIKRKFHGYILGKTVFVIISWVLLFYSISQFNIVLATAIARTKPVFIMLIAYKTLNEQITLRRTTGIAILITSIILSQIL